MPLGWLCNPPRAAQAGHGPAGIQTHRHWASTHSFTLIHLVTTLPGSMVHLRTVKGSPSKREAQGVEKPHMHEGKHA